MTAIQGRLEAQYMLSKNLLAISQIMKITHCTKRADLLKITHYKSAVELFTIYTDKLCANFFGTIPLLSNSVIMAIQRMLDVQENTAKHSISEALTRELIAPPHTLNHYCIFLSATLRRGGFNSLVHSFFFFLDIFVLFLFEFYIYF